MRSKDERNHHHDDLTARTVMRMTARDAAVLDMVLRYGGCTVDQIRRRFFRRRGARSACYARLAQLRDAGLLASFRLPSQTGVGSGRAFLTLGRAGCRVLAERLGVQLGDLRRQQQACAPLFLAHHLAIGDLRLALELASEEQTGLYLQEWIPEHELKRVPLQVAGEARPATVPLVPDGLFTLSRGDGAQQAFLLEMDMGTVAPKRLRAKLRAYFRRPNAEAFPILFVVPDRVRQAAIAAWAAQEAAQQAADPTVVWLTTRERVDPSTILTVPIWQVVGGPQAMALDGSTAWPDSRVLHAAVSPAVPEGRTA